jgi:glycosyltransferase 2 family protein
MENKDDREQLSIDGVEIEKSNTSNDEVKDTKIEENTDKPLKNQISINEVIDNDDHDAELVEAEEKINEQKSKKKTIWKWIFLALNIVVVAVIILSNIFSDDFKNAGPVTINWVWIVCAFLMFVLCMISEQCRFISLIGNSTKIIRPYLAYKTAAIGRYYDSITPLATGGQPFQIYYLKNRGVSTAKSVSVPLAKYILQQIVFVIFVLIIFVTTIIQSKNIIGENVGTTVVGVSSWIGLGLNGFLILLLLLLSANRKLGISLIGGILKLLQKMHIVKNYKEKFTKVMREVVKYQRTINDFAKSPFVIIVNVVGSLIELIAQYSIPFFVICAFNGYSSGLWWQTFILVIMVDLASGYMPMPGGTGAAEFSFYAVFSLVITNKAALVWALLLWRIFSYYLYILQGIVILIYDSIIGNKKNEKLLNKWKSENKNLE